MELPLHVVTDQYGGGWTVRIVDNKAVVQFEAIVGPREDHSTIAAKASFICKAANCHRDLLATLSIIVEEIQRTNGLPHFSEEQMTFMAESITRAGE